MSFSLTKTAIAGILCALVFTSCTCPKCKGSGKTYHSSPARIDLQTGVIHEASSWSSDCWTCDGLGIVSPDTFHKNYKGN